MFQTGLLIKVYLNYFNPLILICYPNGFFVSFVFPFDNNNKTEPLYLIYLVGIPCLLYGLAATQLIRHTEIVQTSKGPVTIYFLLPEHKGSLH